MMLGIASAGKMIDDIKDGQIVKAIFGDETWYIVKQDGAIQYCDENGENVSGLITLSYSNLNAVYVHVGYLRH